MSSTIKCEIPIQDGFEKPCTAVFNSACVFLIADDMPLGAELPDEFFVEFEGNRFSVRKEGEEHVVLDEDRPAFTALVFG
ncbi:hypothetical protein [Pseudomonas sp. PLMAX]|jgi:hypothetical protein|uniref:hypothetical protein n=1 Tax=Pseudomonas sp. PLMAX TaxID=2201998 RepID=UPI0038BDFBE1